MPALEKYFHALKRVLLFSLFFVGTIAVLHFPYDVDAPLSPQEIEAARKYYLAAYEQPIIENKERLEYETEYIRVAKSAAEAGHIEERVPPL